MTWFDYSQRDKVMNSIAVQTVIPIFLLIGAGFLSRKLGVLKSGDERVLSAYVYYFAMPALTLVNLAEINFIAETLNFILAGIIPVFVVLLLYTIIYFIFQFSANTYYLLILSSVFGSLAFYGIPFITFAFPTTQGEQLAILSVASIAPVSVGICITILELYKMRTMTIWKGLGQVLENFSKNPLIISIITGFIIGIFKVKIPPPLSTPLHMLGKTTSTVAIFMLGVFLYGRKYTNLTSAFKLSFLRILFLPMVAFLTTRLFGLPKLESAILVLMHSTPVAVSVIVLSERYDFFKETVASLILVSSIGGGIYLTLWLLILGYP